MASDADGQTERLRELLRHADGDVRKQGLELAAGLADTALFDSLLAGVELSARNEADASAGGYTDVRIAHACSFTAPTVLDLVAAAPSDSNWGRLREGLRSLYVDCRYHAMNLRSLRGFTALERLWIDNVQSFDAESESATFVALRSVTVRFGSATELPPCLLRQRSIEELVLSYTSLQRLDLTHLASLRRLVIEASSHLVELRGVEELSLLDTFDGAGSWVSLDSDSFESLVQNTVAAPFAYEARALRRESNGAIDAAIRDLSRAIELKSSRELWERLGRLHERIGRQKAAEDDYSHALELSGPDAKLLCARANVRHRIGRLVESETDYRAALEVEPYQRNALLGMATLLAASRPVKAAHHATRFLETDPQTSADDAHVLRLRGRIHLDLGETVKALDDFKSVVALEPREPWTLALRAKAGLAVGQPEFALRARSRHWALSDDRARAMRASAERALADRDVGLDVTWVEAAFRAFASDRRFRPQVLAAFLEGVPVSTYDHCGAAAALVERSIHRDGHYFSALSPLWMRKATPRDLLDFVRYLWTLAPPGSATRERRRDVTALFCGTQTIDCRSLSGFDRLERLWIDSPRVRFARALVDLPCLRSLSLPTAEGSRQLLKALSEKTGFEELVVSPWFDRSHMPSLLRDKVRSRRLDGDPA